MVDIPFNGQYGCIGTQRFQNKSQFLIGFFSGFRLQYQFFILRQYFYSFGNFRVFSILSCQLYAYSSIWSWEIGRVLWERYFSKHKNSAPIMFTYPTLLISYVYTVLYTIYCILSSLCNTCITIHFKQCHFYMCTYSSHMYIMYSIPSTASCLCRSVPSPIHIFVCTYSSSLYTCVYKAVVLKLLG